MQKQRDSARNPDKISNSGRKLEVSDTQVAGSAAATVVAAFLASSMGVYGTIIGAGLVSMGATAGTAVFQHLFRRTGEQLRVAANTAPKGLHQASGTLPRQDGTLLLRTAEPPAYGTYGEATTHAAGRRLRWKSLLATALGVFLIAMAVIVGIEKLTGGPVSNAWGEHRTGTSFAPGGSDDDGGGGDTTPKKAPADAPATGDDGRGDQPAPTPSGSADEGTEDGHDGRSGQDADPDDGSGPGTGGSTPADGGDSPAAGDDGAGDASPDAAEPQATP